ncbi:MAG: hypothetical protein EXR94_14585 [Gemmatimonadetes bacterium]|nr:hypothetical protein [Gemmatimonadota bacterium]
MSSKISAGPGRPLDPHRHRTLGRNGDPRRCQRTPLRSPSRAAILTGQYVHTNGIIDNTARDSASHLLPTFARPLSGAGYQTGFFGKWHMGNDDSPRPGFTRWVAMKGQGEATDPKFNVAGTPIE